MLKLEHKSMIKINMGRHKINKSCSVDKCTNIYYSTGLCRKHYNRQWRLTSPKQIRREALMKLKRQQWRAKHPIIKLIKYCSTADCHEKYFSKGLCKYHTGKEYRKRKIPSQTEHTKKYKHAWYIRNRERIAEKQKERYKLLDRDKVNAYHRQWQRAKYAKDPAGELLKVHARRSKTTGIKIIKEDIENWYSRICGICNKPIENKFHIDHKTPLSRGGLHVASNLQLAHPACNWSKNNRLQEEL